MADSAPGPRPQPSAGRPRPQREDYAAGDVLLRIPGEVARLVILCPFAKPGWHARVEGSAARAVFAGSAVFFEDGVYEVRRIERPGAGEALRYELWPWEERFTIRESFEYSREECERVAAVVSAALRKQTAAHALAWTMPLVGLLPARLQDAIEEEYGIPAARATFWSSLSMLGVGTALCLAGFQAAASASMGGPRPSGASAFAFRHIVLLVYLTIESIVRYRVTTSAQVAMGSAPVAVPILLFLWLRDAVRGGARAERAAAQRAATVSSRRTVPPTASDQVAELPDGRLDVRSLLAKPHWGVRSAVHFRDRWWALDDREELRDADPGAPNWRFVLAPWPDHVLVQDPQEYTPEEVRGLAYDAARDAKRPAVESLAVLLGLLPGSVQERLADVYGHDPRTWTTWSTTLLAVAGVFAVAVALTRTARGQAGAGDALAAAAGVALLVDCVLRSKALARGEVRASVLGGLVRPLAERLLALPARA